MIKVDELYKAIEELHGYKENGKEYIFYYDETNNYRKVSIKSNGLNDYRVLNNNFTLGGICIEKVKADKIDNPIGKLNLQRNQELKSKTFFKGNNTFEQCINHKKLYIILDWILDNAYIHYLDIDSIYYTVIDIVDSYCEGNNLPMDLEFALKDELYYIIKENMNDFLSLCIKVNYPNIEKKNINIFSMGLIDIINKAKHKRYYTMDILKFFINMKNGENVLTFLIDNPENILMDSFYSLRQQRCIIFNKSVHIFDEETIDEDKMKEEYMTFNNGKRLENFEFVNSKDLYQIQISDIIIYLVSKYLKFLTYNTVDTIDKFLENLDGDGKKNLLKLLKIIDKSNDEHNFFIETINPQTVNLNRNILNKHIEFKMNYKRNEVI